jgi:MFS family permease
MADRYFRRAMSSASDVPDQGLDNGVLKVAGVVVLGAVMSILDVTVVNVAINTLAAEFDTTLATLARVGRVMAIVGVPMLLGPILGPILGGFLVFIPILVGLALLALFVRHGLRSEHPLLDLRLFGNRVFAAASATLTVFALAVFGGMLLLPLYLQAVRGESALARGLLMAPQGIGAMITMPIAGKLTDRMGVGKIVLPGMLLIIASFVALTQVTATTSYRWLGVVLFVMGLGMGGSMMPVFSGAMQTLRRAAVARATRSWPRRSARRSGGRRGSSSSRRSSRCCCRGRSPSRSTIPTIPTARAPRTRPCP